MKITVEDMIKDTKKNEASENPSQKDNSAAQAPGEWEKLKNMNWKDRGWYIAAYYKFHILAALIAVFLIYTAVLTIRRAALTDALHCLYINSRSEEATNLSVLEDDFAEWLGLEKKELIHAETAFISYGEDATAYSVANLEKIAALVTARELDVMICDTENLHHYAQLNGFLDLEEALPPELLAQVHDRLYYTADADGNKHAFALDLSETPFARASVLAQEPPLLGLVSNSRRTDTAVALIRYIFQ